MFRKLLALSIVVAAMGGGVATNTANAHVLARKPHMSEDQQLKYWQHNIQHAKSTIKFWMSPAQRWRFDGMHPAGALVGSADLAQHRRLLKWSERNYERVYERSWDRADQNIYAAIDRAAQVFGNSSLMRVIIGREGGNVNPRKLARNLCTGGQPGWNLSGSAAFGPFQFMLDHRPACGGGWGTFSSYVYSAFREARRKGMAIPSRYMTPASNLGQALTAGYMLANGGIGHWCASMC